MNPALEKAMRVSRTTRPLPTHLKPILDAEQTIAAMDDAALAALRGKLERDAKDAFFHLWHGLALAHRGDHAAACEAFLEASGLGCNNWRVGWYLAQSAKAAGQLALVDEACAAVLRANPEFWFARELPKHARGFYAQGDHDKVIEQFFQQHPARAKVFVEVGAFDGTHYSNVRRLVEQHGWTGVSVEPVAKNFKKLSDSYHGRDVRCVQACASDTEGEVELNVSTYPHLPDWGSDVASISGEDTERWRKQYGAVWKKEKVPARRLTRILDEAGITDIDLLSVDAEGHDLEVLRGLDFSRFQPQLIVVEYGKQREAIAAFLAEQGYQLQLDNKQDLFMVKPRAVLALPEGEGWGEGEKSSPVSATFSPAERARVLAAISCRDCDDIPKVSNAGEVLPGNPPVQVMHNGVQIIEGSYHGDWMTEIIRQLKGHHEPQEEKVFHEALLTLPANAVMIEAGSFWAYYSMWFNKAIAGAQNHLIEPNAEKFQLSQRHFALNGMTGTFTNGFIGAESKADATFVDWDGRRYALPQIAIDDYVREQGIPFVHVLHADIQGAELDLLRGCRQSIAEGRIGYLFLSTHGDRHPACLEFLKEHGFHVVAEHTVAESAAADGLIVARSNKLAGLDSVAISKRKVSAPSALAEPDLQAALSKLNPHLLKLNVLPVGAGVRAGSIDPRQLVTPGRFDIVLKHLYARHRALGVDSDWARDLYHQHIRAFSNGTCREGDGRKNNIGDYFRSFEATLDSIGQRGFDPAETLVPLGRDNVVIDGAHRVAACLFHRQPVQGLFFDFKANDYGAAYFKQRGLSEAFSDAVALEYCRLKTNTFIATIFPSARGGDGEVRGILNELGRVVYEKHVTLNRNGALNLIKQIYVGEKWLGDWSNNFGGAAGKADPCFRQAGPVRVFVFEADSLDAVREAKQRIRAHFGIENHSVHINDTHEQTIYLGQILLNANSVHFLNHSRPQHLERFHKHLALYAQMLATRRLNPEHFCVDGSAVMAAYGIRDAQDLDFLHYGCDQLETGNRDLSSHNSEVHHHVTTRDDIIFNPENHFYYFGIKFASLDIIRRLKAKRNEGKDQKDVAAIDRLLGGEAKPVSAAPLSPALFNVGAIETSRGANAPFPLTPALSPGETESTQPPVSNPPAKTVRQSNGVQSGPSRPASLPLPQGEGRGEGEGNSRNPITPASAKGSFHFSNDWFATHQPHWDRELKAWAKGRGVIDILEIGSYEGRSACWFLTHIMGNPKSTLTCVDAWEQRSGERVYEESMEEVFQRFVKNCEATGHDSQVTVHRGPSRAVLPTLPAAAFDLIYVDGDHSSEGVHADTLDAYRMLRPGGLLLWDDYYWAPGVKEGVDKACAELGISVTRLGNNASFVKAERGAMLRAPVHGEGVPCSAKLTSSNAFTVTKPGAKIVALVPARNEGEKIAFCFRALACVADAIVYLDDCSDDNTVAIVESIAAECRVERILRKAQWHRDEPGDRNAMLKAGREIGGTHFIVVDADEAFTANCTEGEFLRRKIFALSPGDQLVLTWIQLWRSVDQYRHDGSVWTNNAKPFVFCDDGQCAYSSEFIHTPRVPAPLKGRMHQIPGYTHGLLHFQFVNWRNLLVKQAWYRCLEHIREPQKPVAEINKRYAPSKDETGLGLKSAPDEWFAAYPFFDKTVFDAPDNWREGQIRGWFQEYGRAHFQELDIWDVDWEGKTELGSPSPRPEQNCSFAEAAPAAPGRESARSASTESLRVATPGSASPAQPAPNAERDLLEPGVRNPLPLLGERAGVRADQISDPAQDFIELAQHCFDRGEVSAARDHLERALDVVPNRSDLLVALANLEFQLEDPNAAQRHLKRAVELQPNEVSTQVLLASVSLKLENVEEFEQAIGRALQLNPNEPAALRLLADLNLQHGSVAEAARNYFKLLQQNEADVESLLALGVCFFKQGDQESARLTFERVLQIEPGNELARENLGACGVSVSPKDKDKTSALTPRRGGASTPSTEAGSLAANNRPNVTSAANHEQSSAASSALPLLGERAGVRADQSPTLNLSRYHQPPAGSTERHIDVRPLRAVGASLSAFQALKDYDIRNTGSGLGAAERIIAHIFKNKAKTNWKPTGDFWSQTVVVPVECELRSVANGKLFAELQPESLEAISPEFAQAEAPRRADIESYVIQLRDGGDLGLPAYVTGGLLKKLAPAAAIETNGIYMLDGARRLTASALLHRRTVTVLVGMHEEEYAALLPAESLQTLRQRLAALKWFESYQSVPLLGLKGHRTLKRFELMSLPMLRDQVVMDFGCNTGQACLKAVQAGARQVIGVEGMPDTFAGAQEIARLTGFANLRYANVNFNDADFDRQIEATWSEPADYSFFFSVYRTKELTQRERLFHYIIDKTRKGIFFEGHAHPKIDTLEYHEWLFECFGLKGQFLGNTEGDLRPLFYIDLVACRAAAKGLARPHPGPLPQERERDGIATNSNDSRRASTAANRGDRVTQNQTLHRAPSPGGEGRGEGGRFSKQEEFSPASTPTPLVSAIVSTYANERFMEGRLKDLLAQTLGEKLEIIVVDSASPENEGAIVQRLTEQHPNIRYIRTAERETIYQAWNRGVRAARGKYITNANTDDRLRPDALEVLAGELEAHPEMALVYADFFITNTENEEFHAHTRTGYSIKPDYSPNIMLDGCHMGPQPMWRRSLHEELSWFDESLHAAGDYEFWCRVATRHPMLHLQEFLGLYLHNAAGICNSNSSRTEKETSQVRAKYAQLLPPPAQDLPRGFFYRSAVKPGRFVNIGMVTYNRLAFTQRAIEAVLAKTDFPHVLTVVDNASTDGTREYLTALKQLGVIKNLILLDENVGVAKASNLAWAQEPDAGFYLKLDNDIVVQKGGWLTAMVEVAERIPQIGVLAYNFEPTSYPLKQINGCVVRVKQRGNLGGACLLVPKRTERELGCWCEDYGLYGEEDADYAERVRLTGRIIAYMDDEDIGLHLPAGKAATIDQETYVAADGMEEKQHKEYREWKDQLRKKNAQAGGAYHQNVIAYHKKTKPLKCESTFVKTFQQARKKCVSGAEEGTIPSPSPSGGGSAIASDLGSTSHSASSATNTSRAANAEGKQGTANTVTALPLLGERAGVRENQVSDLVSIVIPVFNRLDMTRPCIEAIHRETKPGTFEIIVVDNASSDGTQEYLQAEEAAGRLRTIRNEENLGFAKATNQGMRAARGEFVLMLNNDTVPLPGWLDAMVTEISSTASIGAVGACLLYPGGELIQHGGVAIGAGQGLLHPYHKDRLRRLDRVPAARQTRDAQAVTGACLLVRRSVLDRIGLLDEAYINGFEDVDFCFRVVTAGWRIRYCAESRVIHHESMTPGRKKNEEANYRRMNATWKTRIKPDESAEDTKRGIQDVLCREKLVQEPGHQRAMELLHELALSRGDQAEAKEWAERLKALSVGSPSPRPSPPGRGSATTSQQDRISTTASNGAPTADAESGVRSSGSTIAPPVLGERAGVRAVQSQIEPVATIVIPTFNNLALTQQCLAALYKTTSPTLAEILIVDNGSVDGTVDFLQAEESAGRLRTILNPTNLGFARGCNQGALAARGEYVLFLNNDTEATHGWLEAMLRACAADFQSAVSPTSSRQGALSPERVRKSEIAEGYEAPSPSPQPSPSGRGSASSSQKVSEPAAASAAASQVGVVGCKLLYPDGSIQHAGIEWMNGVPDHRFRNASATAPEVNERREFDMVTGACFLMPKQLFLELGGFDEVYRNGVEDVDLCLRVRAAGHKVVYEPAAVVYHHEGKSQGRFNHVSDNLKLFFARWKGQFDAQHQLILPKTPRIQKAEKGLLVTPVNVSWDGSFLDLGSLSLVNRELTGSLLGQPLVNLTCLGKNAVPKPLAQMPVFQETARRLRTQSAQPAHVTVRHAWPPNWDGPAKGAWVLIQPWEFGSLPADWLPQLERVDEVWAPSDYVRRVYVDSGVPADKVHVVPNGIDPNQFHPAVPPMELATKKTFKFLFVGGTIQRKGPDLLLKAYLENFTAQDDVCLVIKDFGGQSVYAGQTFEAQIKAAQARPNAPEILYLNSELPPEALPGLYTACDCLVHPYRGEGFGLPVLEAMACALPVVVTAGGSTDDFATDEFAYRVPSVRREFGMSVSGMKLVKAGWMLEPDLVALGERMKWVVTHRDEARVTGRAASEHVRRDWTWDRAAEIAMARLVELGNRRGSARPSPSPRPSPSGRGSASTSSVGSKSSSASSVSSTSSKSPAKAPGKPKPIVLPACAKLAHLAEARELLRQGKLEPAWQATVTALSVRPYHPEAFLLLAEIAQAAGDAKLAKELVQRARQMAPKWKPAQQFAKSSAGKSSPKLQLPALPGYLSLATRAPRLSICLITKNEERFLGQCMESIRDLAQQIVVVDTGSTDATRDIAARFGAEISLFDWCDDFSAARNAALEHATGDWVLFLDADEQLLPDQREKLRKMLKDPSAIAYRLPMIDKGREEEGVSHVPRLFRNAPGLFYVGRVHEQVFSSVEVRRAEWGLENKFGEATLLHHGYTKELVQSRDKIARNLRLLEKAIEEMPGEPNLLMNYGLELVRDGRLQEGLEQYAAAFAALSALPKDQVTPELRESLLTQYCTHLLAAQNHAEVAQVLQSPLAKSGGLTATMHWLFGLACIESKLAAEGAEQMRQCLAKRSKPALTPVNTNILRAGPSHCLALCLAALKQHDAASQAFQAALKDDPNARPVRFDYARFLAETKNEVEALKWLHQLTAEDASEVRVWQFGGLVALSKPEFLEFALDWTGEAIQLHPHHTAIVEQRATALLLSGKADEARKLWQQLDPSTNSSHRAALILCETFVNQPSEPVADEMAGRANQEFVSWYRRLLAFNASTVVQTLNQRIDLLRRVVPAAANVLEMALAEANSVPVK